MGADQQFCLRWNNFHSNITSAFESLRDDEDFVDITLACDGRQIKAHKMVLSACSPYFRSLLKGNPCQHPIVFLKDVTFSNLSSILDFMYHGEVNVSHNELATFLKTAEALKVRGLAEDEKKKDSENYNESSSPPPPRDPPDPGSPRPEESSTSAPDAHLSDSPPPKRQRRRSGNSVNSTEDTSETVLSDQQPVRDTSIKDEPHEFNEEEDILGPQNVDQDNLIKSDEDRNFGPTDSVSIRSQAAMQQLQESFGSFLPGMGQSPGFLPHGATDMPRPPPYPLEGVQGLPPGISALPGPSMSQGAASQDASQGGGSGGVGGGGVGVGVGAGQQRCPLCNKALSRWTSLRRHIEDKHTQGGAHICPICHHVYRTKNSLHNHLSVYHRGATGTRGRRGRYPSYTVLRPTNAHQLAALKAAARHTFREIANLSQQDAAVVSAAAAVAAAAASSQDSLATSTTDTFPLSLVPSAGSPVAEDSDEGRDMMQETTGGFESLLGADGELHGNVSPPPPPFPHPPQNSHNRNNAMAPLPQQELAVTDIADE